jgi:predicted DNA-binding protein YlxM (UPF0122 family)
MRYRDCENCGIEIDAREVVTRCPECKELINKPKTKEMTTKLLKQLETNLFETWGLTLDELKGRDNEHSYIRGCLSYWLCENNCHVVEIAELFEISTGTIYQYLEKHTKELKQQKSIFFDLKMKL